MLPAGLSFASHSWSGESAGIAVSQPSIAATDEIWARLSALEP
jgi:hypothetical protein